VLQQDFHTQQRALLFLWMQKFENKVQKTGNNGKDETFTARETSIMRVAAGDFPVPLRLTLNLMQLSNSFKWTTVYNHERSGKLSVA
jgi:hypothetical protein